jgi:hypothetical protein
VVHKLTGATSSFGPGPYYSVVCSSQFPVLLNWIKNVSIVIQGGPTLTIFAITRLIIVQKF